MKEDKKFSKEEVFSHFFHPDDIYANGIKNIIFNAMEQYATYKGVSEPVKERVEVIVVDNHRENNQEGYWYQFITNKEVWHDKFPAIKEAIESALNDTVVERGIQDEFDAPRMYLQSEVDAIRSHAWHDGVHETYESYLSSLNLNSNH